MKNTTIIIQIISCILIIVSVLLQQKGSGLSGVFGGSTNFYQTKRGAEKVLFYTTVFSAIAFLLATMLQIFYK